MKNLLLEADLEAKQPRGICKARCDALKGSLCVGDKGSVIREEKVLDQPLVRLGVGLEARVLSRLHAGSRLRLPVTSSTCRFRPFPIAAGLLGWLVVERGRVLRPALGSFKVKCSARKLAPPFKHEVHLPWPSKLGR